MSVDGGETAARERLRGDVSRETFERLARFTELVDTWSRKINLVAPADRERLWSRHILDSAGLLPLASPGEDWLDVGSGGGFPIVPLAILAAERGGAVRFEAVEPDQRKAAFLRVARAELGLPLTITAERLESVPAREVDTLSARGCAALDDLLALIRRSQVTARRLVLLKGARVNEELTLAARSWHMRFQKAGHTFATGGHILVIRGTFGSAGGSRHQRHCS